MRVYHIGPPKTGTSSVQSLLHSNPEYLGIKFPRNQEQNPIFREIYQYLLYDGPKPKTNSWPESFVFSEEAVGWNHRNEAVEKRIRLLQELIRPQDRILITTRNPRKALFSWYCERYNDFYPQSLYEVLSHPSFASYDYSSFDQWIPSELKSRVMFVPMEELTAGNFAKVESLLNIQPPLPKINERPKSRTDKIIEVSVTREPLKTFCNFGDKCYARFVDPANKKRFSKSRFNPTFSLKKYIFKPTLNELDSIIQGRFKEGMIWLEKEHGIHYL